MTDKADATTEIATKEFADYCRVLKNSGIREHDFPNGAFIRFSPTTQCPEQDCRTDGLFLGRRLDYGRPYQVFNADFCPTCGRVHLGSYMPFSTDISVSEEHFLPVLRHKLMSKSRYFEEVKPSERCPACDGLTFEYNHTDVQTTYTQESYWRVCINGSCTWEGRYWTERYDD
jgi:hypothetical protein